MAALKIYCYFIYFLIIKDMRHPQYLKRFEHLVIVFCEQKYDEIYRCFEHLKNVVT